MSSLLNLPLESFELLTPEAGDRRYYRAKGSDRKTSWLRVETQTPAPHATADWLQSAGVRTPRLGDSSNGNYLVEDLGDLHLSHSPSLEHYINLLCLRKKFALHPLHSTHPNAQLALNEELFLQELTLSSEHQRAPNHLCSLLAEEASLGPQQIQHRDFHSRNVLILESGELALIDHQDLRKGPLFYDLASLWTDAYVEYSDEVRTLLLDECFQVGAEAGLEESQSAHHFLMTALQRVVKALGTFGRLVQSGREDYRKPEKRALNRARALLSPDRKEDCLHVLPHFVSEWEEWRIFFSQSSTQP
ncbi:MAG: phosphotransferase [Planctomycetota bacterium]|nr:phosphotransferase [Planctomycetota bacterium]